MTNFDLLKRVRGKAHELAAAYDTIEGTYLKHCNALARWREAHTQETEHGIVCTEGAWEEARSKAISHAQSLSSLSAEWLATEEATDYRLIRKQTDALQQAVDLEAARFLDYFNASGGSASHRVVWEKAKRHILRQAYPLMESLLKMDGGFDLRMKGIHAAWTFNQIEGLELKGKRHIPPPPDPLAVRDPSTADTDLDGTLAHNS